MEVCVLINVRAEDSEEDPFPVASLLSDAAGFVVHAVRHHINVSATGGFFPLVLNNCESPEAQQQTNNSLLNASCSPPPKVVRVEMHM